MGRTVIGCWSANRKHFTFFVFHFFLFQANEPPLGRHPVQEKFSIQAHNRSKAVLSGTSVLNLTSLWAQRRREVLKSCYFSSHRLVPRGNERIKILKWKLTTKCLTRCSGMWLTKTPKSRKKISSRLEILCNCSIYETDGPTMALSQRQLVKHSLLEYSI